MYKQHSTASHLLQLRWMVVGATFISTMFLVRSHYISSICPIWQMGLFNVKLGGGWVWYSFCNSEEIDYKSVQVKRQFYGELFTIRCPVSKRGSWKETVTRNTRMLEKSFPIITFLLRMNWYTKWLRIQHEMYQRWSTEYVQKYHGGTLQCRKNSSTNGYELTTQ